MPITQIRSFVKLLKVSDMLLIDAITMIEIKGATIDAINIDFINKELAFEEKAKGISVITTMICAAIIGYGRDFAHAG